MTEHHHDQHHYADNDHHCHHDDSITITEHTEMKGVITGVLRGEGDVGAARAAMKKAAALIEAADGIIGHIKAVVIEEKPVVCLSLTEVGTEPDAQAISTESVCRYEMVCIVFKISADKLREILEAAVIVNLAKYILD